MRVPSSLKLVLATWVAALIGAWAGRSLAEASVAHVDHPPITATVGPAVAETTPVR